MMTPAQPSLLHVPEDARIVGADTVQSLGRLLVLAPHPDDESLGCGGMLALARQARVPVQVVFMTDGSRSHPNSSRYPAAALRDLREHEALVALRALGVAAEAAIFLRWRDGGGLPTPDSQLFPAGVARCRAVIDRFRPETIVTPWRREPHADHRATTLLLRQALIDAGSSTRILEYPIWSWQQGDAPLAHEMHAWRLDVAAVLPQKLKAIRAHRSQTTDLIDDDPTGFRLAPDTLALFSRPWELFLEDRV